MIALAAGLTGGATSVGEAVIFWVLGPISVLAALGMVISRRAVHSALMLAVVMLCLATFYAAQGAPFLAFVQVIVYTGAIMMLFLFVLMVVGVSSADSLVETLRGQRVAAGVVAVGFALTAIALVGQAVSGLTVRGLGAAGGTGNVTGVARLLFTRYVFAFEMTGALLITAALSAMVLAHRERMLPRVTQRERAERRFSGPHPSPLPAPGVYADHDAVDTPALLPDGSVAPDSVAASLTRISAVRFPRPARLPVDESDPHR